uniref:Uncharacterized protein n=1 Tax=Setaria viridis TaxID=4556 RepID=A0A4U6WGT7_SETVI|nr:hypothetical protein SEVIR_1G360900v2 [Setaria viridis]
MYGRRTITSVARWGKGQYGRAPQSWNREQSHVGDGIILDHLSQQFLHPSFRQRLPHVHANAFVNARLHRVVTSEDKRRRRRRQLGCLLDDEAGAQAVSFGDHQHNTHPVVRRSSVHIRARIGFHRILVLHLLHLQARKSQGREAQEMK